MTIWRTTVLLTLLVVTTPGITILCFSLYSIGRIFCSTRRRSVTYVDGTILRINRTYVEKGLHGDFSHCLYQAVTRPSQADSDYTFQYSDFGDKVSTSQFVIRWQFYSERGSQNWCAKIIPLYLEAT
jgi:hypothetical protein